MEVSDRALFLKYALPCAETLIQRGAVNQNAIDSLVQKVSGNKEIPEGAEKIFKVALAMCTLIAKREKKEAIDSDVIRKYFLFRHDDVIDKRHEEMGDFDPEKCRTYPGKVMDIKGNSVSVKTPLGTRKYRKNFTPDLKGGDFVIVHRDFAVEVIDRKAARGLLLMKGYSDIMD